MEKKPSLFLFDDITANDAKRIADWLQDSHVTEYLNEDSAVTDSINNLIDTVCAPLLQYHFNKDGKFFMISNGELPIGFIKLIQKDDGKAHEMVIVIGEEEIWGRGYGKAAVRKCLHMVFFQWRSHKVVANIHYKNTRSLKLFSNSGFYVKRKNKNTVTLEITFDDFLSNLKK
jgi:RimJ/RimL family protein N-acetyltransferase